MRFPLLLTALFIACTWSFVPTALMADDKPKDGAQADKKDNQPQAEPAQTPRRVGWLKLSGPLRETPVPFAWVSEAEAGPSLKSVVRQIHHVADNPAFQGMVIFLESPMIDQAQVFEIEQALRALRAAGKTTMVFAEQYSPTTYALACSADKILLQRKGIVQLMGIGIEEMYLKEMLGKIGIRADLMQVGQYKGASEQMTRTGPSEAWSENMDRVLDDMYAQFIGHIAESRKLTREEVEKAMAGSWTMTDKDYVERKLIDHVVDRDLADVTGEVFGDDFSWDTLMGEGDGKRQQIDNPFALFRMLVQTPTVKPRRPSLAIIYANGPIMSGESSQGGLFSSESIGSETMLDALRDARNDDMIKGVVIRLESPGGSALASEVIWQAVREVGKEKPVYISIASMAASGGYYIACAGEQIYATQTSIIGSIGVVGGKITMGGLYDMLGIGIHRRSRGPLADMFNSVEPFTKEQREKLRTAFENIYQQFTERVKIGRGNRIDDIESVAKGRLFTGRQARENGMIDKVGGVEAALGDLASKVGFEPGNYDVVNLPAPMSLPEFLEQMFGAQAPQVRGGAGVHLASMLGAEQRSVLQAARSIMGEARWRAITPVLDGLMLLRHEPVLTLMPVGILVR